METKMKKLYKSSWIHAHKLGLRETEDLKVPGSIQGFGKRELTVCVTINKLCIGSNEKLLPCHLLF